MTPEQLYDKIKASAAEEGLALNPDGLWVRELMEGLALNIERYGYPSCPGRLASGQRSADEAIICPCRFRAEDLAKYDRCYCHLYISRLALEGRRRVAASVPDRWLRP